MNKSEFHSTEITNIIEINSMVKRFFLKFPFKTSFQSGQFGIIEFGSLNHTYSTRSYSIADIIHEDTIELCVSLKESGAATPILFNFKIGDKLMLSEPQGRFILPENLNSGILGFICTGTGVAPFRAMIKDLLLIRKHQGNIHLFFGCRTQEDILYREEFEALQLNYPNFKYTVVLSRETWNGPMGYVHSYYQPIFESKPEALVYLCGWTNMIKEARDNLKKIGYTRAEIKVEFYD